MSYTVGFDFGTHQTKICIEDASNPLQKLYEFLEFNEKNKKNLLLPSIVQINKDNTISYGFVDDNECKTILHENIKYPELILPQKPVLELPKEPSKIDYPPKQDKVNSKNLTWKEQLLQLQKIKSSKEKFSLKKWKEKCKIIDKKNKENFDVWANICKELTEKYNEEVELWEIKIDKLKNEFESQLLELKKKRVEKLQYRYFKLATFSDTIHWEYQIKPDIISVWYIVYNLFLIQDKIGDEFFLQIGIPSGVNKKILKKQEEKAFAILLAAYRLVDLYKTKEDFIKEKYTDLIEITDINYNYTDEDINFYGLNVIPEAFAGLSAVTQQKRLEAGMNLLVDIGGGTTDIAFFTITKNDLPNIHSVISFPKGLNFIFENYIKHNKGISISEVQDLFSKEKNEDLLFEKDINEYHIFLKKEVKNMVHLIKKSFTSRDSNHRLPISRLNDALKNRPVIFCGGGSLYETMRISVLNFTDKILINKNLLSIPTILNKDIDEKLFTILATSYGLSIPMEDEIKLTDVENVFDHIDVYKIRKKSNDYEHGLTDY